MPRQAGSCLSCQTLGIAHLPQMIIELSNCQQGNRALASVLLLYYHLLREGGFTHDQTVYLEPEAFNGFDYLNVRVANDQRGDIDEQLLREGAVVYVLCELNDMVIDYVQDYLAQPLVQKIIAANANGDLSAVPESSGVLAILSLGERHLDYASYQRELAQIYKRYVVARVRGLLSGSDA